MIPCHRRLGRSKAIESIEILLEILLLRKIKFVMASAGAYFFSKNSMIKYILANFSEAKLLRNPHKSQKIFTIQETD